MWYSRVRWGAVRCAAVWMCGVGGGMRWEVRGRSVVWGAATAASFLSIFVHFCPFPPALLQRYALHTPCDVRLHSAHACWVLIGASPRMSNTAAKAAATRSPASTTRWRGCPGRLGCTSSGSTLLTATRSTSRYSGLGLDFNHFSSISLPSIALHTPCSVLYSILSHLPRFGNVG